MSVQGQGRGNLLTLEKLALFSLLQRERFDVRVAEFEIERHRVALDRSGICRGNLVRLFVSAHRPAAFHSMDPAQVEIAFAIDDQRSLNHSTRTVVFNRRQLRANVHTNVQAAPVSRRDVLHLLSHRDDGKHGEQNNHSDDSAALQKHKTCRIVGFNESFTQRRYDVEKLSHNLSRSTLTAGENDLSSKSAFAQSGFSGN
jgi:hypothetical protein